jgi:hypothetical protein
LDKDEEEEESVERLSNVTMAFLDDDEHHKFLKVYNS